MFHGAAGTANGSCNMAFTNAARSFDDTRTKNSTEKKPSTNGMVKPAATGNYWGVNSIWSGGANGLTMPTTGREHSLSRDHTPQGMAAHAEQTEQKTGSGSLVDSSVSEDYANMSWGKRGSLTGLSMHSARLNDSSIYQHRSTSHAGLQTLSGASQGLMAFGTRPATVNLNQSGAVQSRQHFAPTFDFQADFSGRFGEQPPFNVYTKFDRPTDPSLKKPDSARGYSSTTPSPSDERRPQFPTQYNRTASMPTSRDGSLPPSRGAEDAPHFTHPDYSRTSQFVSPSSSRASSMRNGTHNPYFNVDHLPSSKQQPNLNSESRPGTSMLNRWSGFSHYQGFSPAAVRPGIHPANHRQDDMDDCNSAGMQDLRLDDFLPAQPTNTSSSASIGQRHLNAGALTEFRPGQPYFSSHDLLPIHDVTNDSRTPSSWQGNYIGSQSISRRSPAIAEPSSYTKPHLQQLIAAQLRNTYMGVYNPYSLQIHPSFMPPYPIITTGLDIPATPRDSLMNTAQGLQSMLLYEFKTNAKSKRYELKDIANHVVEFAVDQYGSRFIQTKLETANSDDKNYVFQEIEPNAIQLMTDVFGNYVVQKFFESGDQTHKKALATHMRGQVLNLSLQMYGCRVVQKAFEYVLVDQQRELVRELEHHVLKCVKDQNGNHVIQKAIERCPPAIIESIIAAFQGQVQHLSIHPYGCRVIQRCLEKTDLPSKSMIMAELIQGIKTMVSDQFGNYVVQHIVEHDEGEARQQVMNTVALGLEGYSKHKFASNVVEKCLERADDGWRQRVVYQLLDANARRTEGEGVLVGLIKHNFGNYVIQKLLDTLVPIDYHFFLESLQPAMAHAKRTGCGKQVLSIEKKMHRFESCHYDSISHHPSFQERYGHGYQLPVQIPASMAPFPGNFNSAATTPPPLTADSQSLQSSCLPSVNGDAVEGAAASRKGSDPSSLHGMDGVHR